MGGGGTVGAGFKGSDFFRSPQNQKEGFLTYISKAHSIEINGPKNDESMTKDVRYVYI